MGNALDEMQEFAVSFHFPEEKNEIESSVSPNKVKDQWSTMRAAPLLSLHALVRGETLSNIFLFLFAMHKSFDVRSVVSHTIRIIFR